MQVQGGGGQGVHAGQCVCGGLMQIRGGVRVCVCVGGGNWAHAGQGKSAWGGWVG